MAIVQSFGMWEVDDELGLIGRLKAHNYSVATSDLYSKRTEGEVSVYDMLLHLYSRTFTTNENVDDLNKAYRYALDFFGEEDSNQIDTIFSASKTFQARYLNNDQR